MTNPVGPWERGNMAALVHIHARSAIARHARKAEVGQDQSFATHNWLPNS